MKVGMPPGMLLGVIRVHGTARQFNQWFSYSYGTVEWGGLP